LTLLWVTIGRQRRPEPTVQNGGYLKSSLSTPHLTRTSAA